MSSYAEDRIYDLFNVADHVSRLAQDAQIAAEHGRTAQALVCLETAERSAGLVQMHLRDAIAATKKVAEVNS